MNHRFFVVAAALPAPLCLIAFVTDIGWLLALACALFPAALIGLGVRDGAVHGALVWILTAFALLLGGNLLGILSYSGSGILWGPVPPGFILLLVGIGAIPLPLLCGAYAATFERSGVSQDDLERIRRLAVTYRRTTERL